LNLTVKIKIIL